MKKPTKKKLKIIDEIIKEHSYAFDEYNSNLSAIRDSMDEVESTFGLTSREVLLVMSVFRAYWFNFYIDEPLSVDQIRIANYKKIPNFDNLINEYAFKNDNRGNVKDNDELNKLDINSIFATTYKLVEDINSVIKTGNRS